MKGIAFIVAVLTCSAALGQQRVERPGGYYLWSKSSCGTYGWSWYPYAKQAAGAHYDSKTYITNYNNYGAEAFKGNTVWGISDYDPAAYLGADNGDGGDELAKLLVEGGVKIGLSANTLATLKQHDRADIAKEHLRVEQYKGLALIAKESKPESVKASVEVHASAAVESTDGVVDLSGTYKKCSNCHSQAAAEAMGGDVKLPPFTEMDGEQAKLAFDYITTLEDRNCARKANLSSAEHTALRDYLCDRKAK